MSILTRDAVLGTPWPYICLFWVCFVCICLFLITAKPAQEERYYLWTQSLKTQTEKLILVKSNSWNVES